MQERLEQSQSLKQAWCVHCFDMLNPRVNKNVLHILSCKGWSCHVFTNLTVRSQKHIDSNIMGFCLPLTSCNTGVQNKPPGWWFNAAFMSYGKYSAFNWQTLWEKKKKKKLTSAQGVIATLRVMWWTLVCKTSEIWHHSLHIHQREYIVYIEYILFSPSFLFAWTGHGWDVYK